MTGKMIIDKVKEAGVVGAGGAGFPTHVKIDADVDTVIVNGAECEPLLRVDQELMEKRTAELINGLEFVREATGAQQLVIALKGKYEKAIKNLTKEISNKNQFTIFELGDFYPAGDEQQLVYEVTGKIVPEGGIPLQAGVVVINVETVINIDNAIKEKAVTYKYVTVTGEVKKPITVYVPVGTPVKDLLLLAGGATTDDYALIDGGPMMGDYITEDNVVTKTTKGILVLPEDHSIIQNRTLSVKSMVRRAMSACCQCRACTDVCPRFLLGHSLEPHKIMRSIAYGLDTNTETITSAMLCCECGACDTCGCPMGLSPRNINIHIKNELTKNGYKNTHKISPEDTHLMREYRKIPVKRLTKRVGVYDYDLPAPITDTKFKPDYLEFPLVQHIGAPAVPVVSVGDKVGAGDKIAKIPANSLGAAIHTGLTGIVKAIGDMIKIDVS